MSEVEPPHQEQNLLNRFRENLREALILTVVFYLLIALLLVIDLVLQSMTSVESPGVKLSYIIIAIVPFIALLLVSGELEEIRGPGGISFLMQNEASTTISPISETTISVEPDTVMQKGDVETGELYEEEVGKLAERVQRIQPTALSFQIGRKNYYVNDAIEAYLHANLTRNPSFKFILFTGLDNEFEGFVPIDEFVFMHRLRIDELVRDIENGDILEYPEVITESVQTNATNREVLEKLNQTNEDMLAVVDDSGAFVGTIKQSQIIRGALLRVFQRSQA